MNAEFNVWLLIVGLVVGAGLVWLVIMDSRRREAEIDAVERPREAAWLSAVLAEDGFDVSPDAAERLLVLHRAYLDAPPPDGAMGETRRRDGRAGRPRSADPATPGQRSLTRTGSVSMVVAETSTSETPNVDASVAPAMTGDGADASRRGRRRRTSCRCAARAPAISTQQRYS